MKYLQTLQLIFSLLPVLHTAVDQIEDLFPQGGFGAHKLAMLKGILENAMNISEVGSGVFTQIWPMLMNIVTQIVAVKNSIKGTPVGGAYIPSSIAK